LQISEKNSPSNSPVAAPTQPPHVPETQVVHPQSALEESVSPLVDPLVRTFTPAPPSLPTSPQIPAIPSPAPSPPPRKVEVSTLSIPDDEDDDEMDGISVTPSPTNKSIQAKREFIPVSHVLKVIVLGDASVGKTALIQRFVHGSYQVLPYKPTVGADFYSQKLEFLNSKNGEKSLVTLQIWDTAGQERYRSLASSFYRGADVCILVYDGSRPSSLSSLELWKSDFLRHAQPNNPDAFPFIFLRNKSDLLQDDEANASGNDSYASIPEQFQVPKSRVVSVSAKSGFNVEKAFHLGAKIGVKKALKSSSAIRAQAAAAAAAAANPGNRLVNLGGNRNDDQNDSACQC